MHLGHGSSNSLTPGSCRWSLDELGCNGLECGGVNCADVIAGGQYDGMASLCMGRITSQVMGCQLLPRYERGNAGVARKKNIWGVVGGKGGGPRPWYKHPEFMLSKNEMTSPRSL